MTYQDSTAAAAPHRCPMCGKLEHGSIACNAVQEPIIVPTKVTINVNYAPFGTLVRCLNCGILWRRITEFESSSGTVLTADVQLVCPKCGSNAYEIGTNESPKKPTKGNGANKNKELERRLREVEDELLRERLNRVNKAAGFPDNTIGV